MTVNRRSQLALVALIALLTPAVGCLESAENGSHGPGHAVSGTADNRPPRGAPSGAPGIYDPLTAARASVGLVANREAVIPPQCYTATAGVSNPCWTCHTTTSFPNFMSDWSLQEEYAFSDVGLRNHWQNLFSDRREDIAAITDEAIQAYVAEDNYTALRASLQGRGDYPGYVPDLDFGRGFDESGFARDGSGWRAFRYKPFPGTFWPTNGSIDDVMVRLPAEFRRDAQGRSSTLVYRANLAILEASLASDPDIPADQLIWPLAALDERALGVDLDGDEQLGTATSLRGLPASYLGAASAVAVVRGLYPKGVEFLHSVRYLDARADNFMATRMKELRYSRKVQFLDRWGLLRAYEEEYEAKEEGVLPVFSGSPLVGLRNDFGWQLQGFIEDADGRLRLQTEEEHLFCMGCHSTVGVTVDQTFAFPRKVPGAAGWGYQDLRGQVDVPQLGHDEPEILTYLRRVGGGDEFRGNQEMLDRFFSAGQLDEAEVRRAAAGGDRDIRHLIVPTAERATQLNKAYRVLVREQRFDLGRDGLLAPAVHVHQRIVNGTTELGAAQRVFTDGRLRLQW